jgi:hypothetical protein
LKPQIYLPFQELLLWLQLEVSRKNYNHAEAIVKRYIAYTTNLINDETGAVISLDLKRKSGPNDPWKPKSEILDLLESQYYKLIDVYLFDILLPDRGYDETKEILLKDIAVEKPLKLEYLDKLGEHYISTIKESHMMRGTEAIEQFNKAKYKSQLTNRVNEIKNATNNGQQGENHLGEDTSNPLFQSTFNRENYDVNRQNNQPKKGWRNFIFNFKTKVGPKTFAAIMTVGFNLQKNRKNAYYFTSLIF